jgi:hypothetical protein
VAARGPADLPRRHRGGRRPRLPGCRAQAVRWRTSASWCSPCREATVPDTWASPAVEYRIPGRRGLMLYAVEPALHLARLDRLRAAIDRDGGTCVWCSRAFGNLVMPTTEHLVPRVKGGPSWLENEVAACRRCNRERGHRSLAQWADECRRRGWHPDVMRVSRALAALARAIAERGGQRRARPYIAHERRRLARL